MKHSIICVQMLGYYIHVSHESIDNTVLPLYAVLLCLSGMSVAVVTRKRADALSHNAFVYLFTERAYMYINHEFRSCALKSTYCVSLQV